MFKSIDSVLENSISSQIKPSLFKLLTVTEFKKYLHSSMLNPLGFPCNFAVIFCWYVSVPWACQALNVTAGLCQPQVFILCCLLGARHQ